MTSVFDSLQSKRDEVLRLATLHGARNLRVFGSIARGDAGAMSDVDLLVDMEPGRSLLDMGGLLMDLQDLLGCDVDIVTENGLRPRIRDRVLDEAVPLSETTGNACSIYSRRSSVSRGTARGVVTPFLVMS